MLVRAQAEEGVSKRGYVSVGRTEQGIVGCGGTACVEEARRRTDASSIGAEPGWQASHFPEPLTIVAADKRDPMSVWCVWQRQGLCVRKRALV